MSQWTRRSFLKRTGVAVASGAALQDGLGLQGLVEPAPEVPPFLEGYEKLYAQSPRAATLAWFKDAKFGLFMHYGLYSLLGRHEWVMFRENIPVATYEKLREGFTASGFDSDRITDMALDAGMKYICITTRHHDGFCIFESSASHYDATMAAAKGANLLLNTGPLGDGSIHPEDRITLAEVGKQLRRR